MSIIMKRMYASIITALLLCFGLGARADNIVTIGTAEGVPGDEVTVSVGLQNTDALSSLQISIPLGENLSLVEESAKVGNRCVGHAVSTGVNDGTLQLVIYSLSMATIAAGNGEVASFKLKLGNEPVSFTLKPSKMVLTDGSGNTTSGSSQNGSVTIRCAKAQFGIDEIDFGRVPIRSTYTREVTVTNVGNADLVVSNLEFSDINVFSTTTSLPKTIPAGQTADFNVTYAPVERGAIERQLRIVSNSATRIRAIKLKSQPYAVNELHIGNASGISDEEVTISMRMNNMDDISGYQLDFKLPSSLQYVDGSFALNEERKLDHVGAASMVDDQLRIVVYSPSGKALKDNDGEIGVFKVKLAGKNSVTLRPTKTVLTATIKNKVENVVSDVYGGQVTIQYPTISTNGEIDFGAVPVTEECKQTFTIRNYGSAPLTVNRIVFNNEHLSVTEEMPLTIPSRESKNVTVVYTGLEQKAFETKMQIYSNDPELRLREVVVRGSRFAPNYMGLNIPNIFEDETLKVNLAVNTYDNITGLQFDMVYPNNLFVPFDDNVVLGERAQGMTVSSRQMSDNTIRYVCYFLAGGGVAAGEGDVMTITLKPVNEITPEGAYAINIKNVKLGTTELTEKYAGSDLSSSFRVKKHNPVTITAKSYTRQYGDANPTFEFTSEGATVSGQPAFSCEATATSPVGEYPIIISKGSVTNEEDSYVNGVLTITKTPLTIKAKSYTMKQGDALPTFEVEYSGFRNDEANDVLTKQPTITCEATSATSPGTYVIIVSEAEAQNYEISYVKGVLTINEADPVKVTAKSYTIKYGDAIPEFDFTSSGAELSGTPVITCEASSTSPVGTYPIVITKGNVINYNDSYVNGVLTITKATLTISVGNYEKKQYDPMPEFAVSFDGFKNNESEDVLTKQPTISCEANEDSIPGEYAITVSGAEAENYEILYTAGKLTVTEPESYTLTYMVDGEVYKSFSIKYRDAITPLEALAKEGYTFSGWSVIPETMPANDVVVTGTFSVNSYTLTYKVDGEVYKTTPIAYGTALTPETAPTKEGYTFSGWSEIPATMPAQDVIVTGSFSVNSYTLTYKVDGEVYKTVPIAYGTALTPEDAPTKEGYTFSGWSEIPETMPAKDVVITGSFTVNSYTLTYKVDDEVYKTTPIAYGTALTPEVAPKKEGYTFSGWSEIPEKMPAKDVVVTGSFTVNSYTLTYMVDGEVYKTTPIAYGTALTPEDAPTKEGYTFSGWSEIPETMPAKDVTVTGSFTVNSYTLTYKVDGEVYKTVPIAYGTALTPEVAPTKEGYTFSGWSEIPETMPANDVVVTGTFSVNSYTLTYMVDGEVYKTTPIAYGTALTPETAPTKEGYTFSGWSEIPEKMPAKDVVVTGSFTVNSYTLTYMVDGEVYKATPIAYGTELTPEPAPTKEGYTFSGWSEIPETMPANDVEVTGSFKINKYLLTYEVDGEIIKSDSIEYNSILTLIEEPTKEGYTFSGWSEIPETMPAKDVVVTGSFTINSYTITYVLDGEVYTTDTLEYGAEIVPPVILGLEDYTIWEDVPETMPASDITVYGKAKEIIDGIGPIQNSKFNIQNGEETYDLSGRKVNSSFFTLHSSFKRGGINIIRTSDGTIRKVLIR